MVFKTRHEIRRGICLALESEMEDENKGENEGKDDLQNQKEASGASHAMWEYSVMRTVNICLAFAAYQLDVFIIPISQMSN